METSLNTAIPVRRESERVWLVRASGGQYVRHFKFAGVAAVGHLDDLDLAPHVKHTKDKFVLTPKELRARLENKTGHGRATLTSHISQVQQFCTDMKIGDLLVTVDSRSVAVGRVSGYVFLDRTPIDLSTDEYKDVPMRYQLRRPIVWGPSFARRELPLPMERVFRSHRTVFEVTKFWDYIYHLLYPAFVYKDELHLTLRLQQDESIRNKDVLSVLSILQDFERHAAELADDPIIDTLTVRAGFFSKGDIWPRLTAKEKKCVFYLALATVLLGGGEIGPLKLNGLGPLVKDVMAAAEEIISRHEGREALQNMQIQIPRTNTAPIDTMPAEPTNEETIMIAQR